MADVGKDPIFEIKNSINLLAKNIKMFKSYGQVLENRTIIFKLKD